MGAVDIPMQEKKLERLDRACLRHEVSATGITNFLRPGATHEVSLALRDAVDECVGYLQVMEPAEVDGVRMSLPEGYRGVFDSVFGGARGDEYLEKLAAYHLAVRLSRRRERSFFEDVLGADPGAGEVFEAFPELREKLDDDGLLIVDGDLGLLEAGIEYRGHVLRYHRFFLGGPDSSPDRALFWSFRDYYNASKGENRFRVAVDPRPPITLEEYERRLLVELSTWYGPQFGADKLDDPDLVGLAVVLRDRPSPYEMRGPVWERTEFLWKQRDGLKTLEVEEVSDPRHAREGRVQNRYVHAQRDVERKRIVHFDGAVKVYPEDAYRERHGARLGDPGGRPEKVKLFRIDGDVNVGRWLELVGGFFSGNEMVVEYFDPARFEEEYAPQIRAYQERLAAPRERGES